MWAPAMRPWAVTLLPGVGVTGLLARPGAIKGALVDEGHQVRRTGCAHCVWASRCRLEGACLWLAPVGVDAHCSGVESAHQVNCAVANVDRMGLCDLEHVQMPRRPRGSGFGADTSSPQRTTENTSARKGIVPRPAVIAKHTHRPDETLEALDAHYARNYAGVLY